MSYTPTTISNSSEYGCHSRSQHNTVVFNLFCSLDPCVILSVVCVCVVDHEQWCILNTLHSWFPTANWWVFKASIVLGRMYIPMHHCTNLHILFSSSLFRLASISCRYISILASFGLHSEYLSLFAQMLCLLFA